MIKTELRMQEQDQKPFLLLTLTVSEEVGEGGKDHSGDSWENIPCHMMLCSEIKYKL